MNGMVIEFRGERLIPRRSGALFWPARAMLIVSDLHLGKSGRQARRGGSLLPPYETRETLTRLSGDIGETAPDIVVCLGDSFDDSLAANELCGDDRDKVSRLQKDRTWIWIMGNHDPEVAGVGGQNLTELEVEPFVLRHIACKDCLPGEISGHYHPKARLQSASRPCFLVDDTRLIMPAYGHYTGGLAWTAPELRGLFADRATAYLTGRQVLAVPVPRVA